jgi:hypothetical protein
MRISGSLDKQFYAWALSRLDPETLGFAFRAGEIRFLDRSAVSKILGVRSGSKKKSDLCLGDLGLA